MRPSTRRCAALFATSAILAVLAAPAAAQTQTPAPEAVQPTAEQQDATTTNTVAELVVTATGREAALQDVPLAVTALAEESIKDAGVTDVRAVQQLAPSFSLGVGQSNATGAVAAIRGIGTGGDNPGFESAVGFFIDGVYRNRSGVALSELPEVERIEVLRGPQGTLFGRNTTAGAISITTKAPEDELRIFGEATLGNYNRRGLIAGVTGPLVEDVLAGKIEANIQKRDGFLEDVRSGREVNDRDRYSVRGQLLWDINDQASLRVIADVAETDEQCCGAVTSRQGSSATAINTIARLRAGIGVLSPDPEAREFTLSPERDLTEQIKEAGISGQLDYEFANGMELTSITAYRDWQAERGQDIDFTDIDRAYRDGYETGFETFTQEIRLRGQVGRVDYLVGGFYGNEKLDLTDTVRFGSDAARYLDALAAGADLNGPLPGGTGFTIYGSLNPAAPLLFQAALAPAVGLPTATAFANAVRAAAPVAGQGQQADRFNVETNSFSVFTHNEVTLTDQLTLTVGLRYNNEQKEMEADLLSVAPTCNVFQAFQPITQALITGPLAQLMTIGCNPAVNSIANGTYSKEREESEVNGTVSLGYKPMDDLLIYGGYSRGYKAGGFNLDRSGFNITPATAIKPNVDDLEFDAEFVDAYELGVKSTLFGGAANLNATLFHQKIEDYQLLAFSGFNFLTLNVPKVISRGLEIDASTSPAEGLVLTGGLLFNEAFFDQDVTFTNGARITEGTRLSNTPKYTVTSSFSYTTPIEGTGLQGRVFFDARYASSTRTQTLGRDPLGSTDNDGYILVNGRVGVGPEDGPWSVELFVRNLTDEYFNVGGFAVPEQDNFAVYPNEPRTYGVSLRYNY